MDSPSHNKVYHKIEGNNQAFLDALARYVDENKSDPLTKKQIEGWELSWEDQRASADNLFSSAEWSFSPTDVIQGKLVWKGEYTIAEIYALCCWEPSQNSEKASKLPKEGSLYFSLRANLRFRTKYDKDQTESTKTRDEKKSEDKIRSKMIQRLRDDKFIKQLLSDEKKFPKKSQESAVLCEAFLKVYTPENQSEPQFEERVDVTDNVAESIRRAVFSRAESSLDVVDLLLNLPILPCSIHKVVPCPLADRAKLRLLEDAMFDECERHDDELIDDLTIVASNMESGSNKRTKR